MTVIWTIPKLETIVLFIDLDIQEDVTFDDTFMLLTLTKATSEDFFEASTWEHLYIARLLCWSPESDCTGEALPYPVPWRKFFDDDQEVRSLERPDDLLPY